jgi:hypothetical protein
MMPTAIRIFVLALVASATACAQGGSGDPSDAAGSGADAKPNDGPTNDIAPPTDGAVDGPADAMMMVDALPPGSNIFCSNSGMCATGECCFTFFGQSAQGACVTGEEVLGVCFPQ